MARTSVLLLATAILLLTGSQGAGLRSSVECLSGQGVSLSSFKCTSCEPGTFSNGRTPCAPCPKNTYAELPGSAECVACPTEFQWRPVCVQADGSYSTANCETGALACWRPAQVASAEAQEHATSRHLMSNLMSRVVRALKQLPAPIENVTVAPPPSAVTPPAPAPSTAPPSPYRDALPVYTGPEGTPAYGGDYIQFLYDEVAYVALPGGSYINVQGTLVYASVNGGPIFSSIYGGQVLAPVNGAPAAVYPGYAGAYPGGGVGYPGTYPTVGTTPVYSSTYGGPVYGIYQANTPPGATTPPQYGTYAVYGSYGQSGTYGSYGVYGAYVPVYPAPTYGSYAAPLYGAYGSGLTPGGAYGAQVSGIYGAYGPQTAPTYGPTYLPGPGYGPASVGYGPAYAGNSPVYGLPLYGIDLAPVYYKPGMRRRRH